MRIVVDIDGILCEETHKNHLNYAACKPIITNISKVNELYNCGHEIILFSSRYEEDRQTTITWLKKFEVRYNKLLLDKPKGDFYIDDKSANLADL